GLAKHARGGVGAGELRSPQDSGLTAKWPGKPGHFSFLRSDQSILVPDCSTALPQRGISDLTKSPSSFGVLGTGSAPVDSNLSCKPLSVSALRTAAFHTSTISFGVPFGAHRPSQAVRTKPGTAL